MLNQHICPKCDGTGARLHRYYQAMAQDAMAFRNYREARKAGDNSVPHPKPNTSYPEWAASLNTHVIDGRSDEQLRTEIVAKYKAIGIKM